MSNGPEISCENAAKMQLRNVTFARKKTRSFFSHSELSSRKSMLRTVLLGWRMAGMVQVLHSSAWLDKSPVQPPAWIDYAKELFNFFVIFFLFSIHAQFHVEVRATFRV